MTNMAVNMQVLFSGLALGSIYALVALGFVLIIRATNVVNFAQGDFAMVGAYAMLTMFTVLKLPYWLAFLLALMEEKARFGILRTLRMVRGHHTPVKCQETTCCPN